MRKNIDKQEVCEDIAKEVRLDVRTIRKITDFQFKLLSEHIHEVKEEEFKLPYIGKVYLKSKPEPDLLNDFEL